MSLEVLRYKTAIGRPALSLPAKLLFQSGLVSDETSVLDYGCGRGDDVKFLKELGVPAVGWDPHFQPDPTLLTQHDIVNLGFVLNVIEDPRERKTVLNEAYSLTEKCLAVSVMLHSQNDTTTSIPFSDGQLTAKKTFQKYYDQLELEKLISNELSASPIAAAPGVFFIFKDESLEQDFLLKRQLGIIQAYEPRDLLTKVNERKEKSDLIIRTTQNLVRHTLAFARKPELNELPRYFQQQLAKTELSYRRVFNAASQQISEAELKAAVVRKKEQLKLFFAMYLFSSRPKYKQLSSTLQKDVRLHFGAMKDLEKDARGLLFSLGDTDLLLADSLDAQEAGLGVYKDEKFTLRSEHLPDIPIRLRGVVSLAERLAGTIEGNDLIRIHIESKKVSYIKVDNFDVGPLPRMLSRTIVKFRENDIINLDHCKDGRVKTVYLKSRWMDKKDKNYQAQVDFDNLIMNTLDLDFSGEGPKFEDFAKALMENKIPLPDYQN
jgi:DNA phosphorothioation-associated putative methyltransferase